MTNKTRRTEIHIETHNVTIIRTRGSRSQTYCHRCQTTVTTFTPEQIAAFLQGHMGEVLNLAAESEFHLVEKHDGLPLVCGNSMSNKLQFVERPNQ